MSETLRLEPFKRIEGHGRVSLFVDDDGRVTDAQFDVTEFRGFERMLLGRMVWEMPLITSRVCGICPVSHHIAAVKAVDDLLGAELPPAATLLRELLTLGGFVHDHALHFFFLAGPDFLTGDAPVSRDLLGVIEARPELAAAAIRMRKAGQRVVELVGGQTGHPVTAIPGGMSTPLAPEARDELLALVRDVLPDALQAAALARECTLRLLESHAGLFSTPMPSFALRGTNGCLGLYSGIPTVQGEFGGIADVFTGHDYREHIAERTLPHSYAKLPYLVSCGPEKGSYRVGPLARMNIAGALRGEHANEMLRRFRAELGSPVHDTPAYHWARMIEQVAVLERIEAILSNPTVVSDEVRVRMERGPGVGVGLVEAPRGTLNHRYEADEVGRVTSAELIVATTHNNAAINAAVLEATVGARPVDGKLDEETQTRVDLGIRAYDPCLSCATHEAGRPAFSLRVVPGGR